MNRIAPLSIEASDMANQAVTTSAGSNPSVGPGAKTQNRDPVLLL